MNGSILLLFATSLWTVNADLAKPVGFTRERVTGGASDARSITALADAPRSDDFRVKDPRCVPGRCVCFPTRSAAASLKNAGISSTIPRTGVDCVVADFDGNGAMDYAIPLGEGEASVLLYDRRGLLKEVRLDAEGVLEPYAPRRTRGANGEPASENYSLLVRWVGQTHVVFVWNGSGFERRRFPAR